MKRNSLWSLTILVVAVLLLSGCGGGGSSASVAPVPATPVAVVTLATEVTGTIPAGTTINGYDITMTLPPDTTCRSTVNPPQTDAGVVTAIGSATGSLVSAVYTKATVSLPGTVTITVVNGPGFDAGAFCRVRCDLANGARPAASDFTPLTLDAATGLVSGSTTTDLTSQLTVTASVSIQ